MKILAISDLHTTCLKGLDRYVRDCALVLVAGDFTEHGRTRGVEQSVRWVLDVFCPWCASFPDVRFCVVPGEQDLFAERRADEIRWLPIPRRGRARWRGSRSTASPVRRT